MNSIIIIGQQLLLHNAKFGDSLSGSVCTVIGTEYGPGTTVTAEILKLYV